MARIHLRKAAKDYPQNGIKKGDQYYFVKIKTGPRSSRTIRSLTRPKRWELTQSDFYQQLWPIEDEGFDNVNEASDLNDIAQQLRDLGQEQQDKFDNMPEGLQQGDTGQQVEQRALQCEEWADAIEQTANELENALSAFDSFVAEHETYRDALADDATEPDEPTRPEALDEVDMTDEAAVAEARQQLINEAVEECTNANPGFD